MADDITSRLPADPHAEHHLIGTLICHRDKVAEAMSIVTPADFTDDRCRSAFENIVVLEETSDAPDCGCFALELSKRLPNGWDQVIEYIDGSFTAPSVAWLCVNLERLSNRRKLICDMSGLTMDAGRVVAGDDDLMEQAAAIAFDHMRTMDRGDDSTDLVAELHAAYSRAEAESMQQTQQRGVPTGFIELDGLLTHAGFMPGQLVIVAARPSIGKSAWLLDCALAMLHKGHNVAIFSMEMDREEIANRVASKLAKVHVRQLVAGALDSQAFERLQQGIIQLAGRKLHILDRAQISGAGIRAKARQLIAMDDVSCIMVDHLGLIQPPNSREQNRVQQVSALTRDLKIMAREIGVPVIAACQLNRQLESRKDDDKLPKLSDLRDSGSIEQDADIVLMLHRDDYYAQRTSTNFIATNLADMLIAKQRNGPTGRVKLQFDATTATFRNLTNRAQP